MKYAVTNNFSCICEDCLADFKEFDLHQPAFKTEVLGVCECCGEEDFPTN